MPTYISKLQKSFVFPQNACVTLGFLIICARLNGSLYHRRGLHRLTESASPFTLVSFVSLSTKNLKSINDHDINAKITGSAVRVA